MELADTSAWVLTRRAEARALGTEFDERVLSLEVATCDMVRFELLWSARNGAELTRLVWELDALPDCPIGKREWQRALWVLERLGAQGGLHHRSVQHTDLLIAAAAERAGVAVIHYDEDFDRIAAITGQPTRWILPRGSL